MPSRLTLRMKKPPDQFGREIDFYGVAEGSTVGDSAVGGTAVGGTAVGGSGVKVAVGVGVSVNGTVGVMVGVGGV